MNESEDVYRQLQQHLDRMPVPYPATGSGVELRILKQLFTPEEARAALWLSAIPETLESIHRRARHEMGREDLRDLLDRMGEKGSIQRFERQGAALYGKLPLVLGMYEAQVDRLTPELERDVRAYIDEAFGRELLAEGTTKQMRTVPVGESLQVQWPVASHDDIRRYVESAEGPFGAIHCICRQGKDLTGEPCRQTQERRNCLMLGAAARATIDKGVARELSREEMLGMLEQADRDGLVLQPQNTREPMFVCCCCGCCCGILGAARKLESPAAAFEADYVAEVDGELCEVCGACETRCQMDAIAADGAVVVRQERCIGCGLCVTTCPSGAMRLRKLEGRKPPPENMRALYSKMFQERFGRAAVAVALAGHVVGRKI